MTKLLLISFLFSGIAGLSQSQSNLFSTSDFNLKGPIKSIEVTVTKQVQHTGKRKKDTYFSIDTLEKGVFEFSSENFLVNYIDSNFHLIHFKPVHNLDSLKFKIEYDDSCACEVATRLMMDSSEYEIHYRKYNPAGWLISDRVVLREKFEIYHQGSILHSYAYDQYGNVTNHWFKSSFVFALIDNSCFEYVYDHHGNWIERRQYALPFSQEAFAEFKSDSTDTPLYTKYRKIEYY